MWLKDGLFCVNVVCWQTVCTAISISEKAWG